MPNKERGEYALTVGVSRFILRLTTQACCELEDFSGRRFDLTLKGSSRGTVRDLRDLLWASLRDCHADVAIESDDGRHAIGMLMDVAGLPAIRDHLYRFIALNADHGDTGGAVKTGTRPRQPRGTGGSSTWMPSYVV